MAHAHRTQCIHYEAGVLKETCACGSVRFTPSFWTGVTDKRSSSEFTENAKVLARIKELNQQFGREGDPKFMSEPMQPTQKPAAKVAPRTRRKEIDANKRQIIADVKTLGVEATKKKYHISRNAWLHLVERWPLPASDGPPKAAQQRASLMMRLEPPERCPFLGVNLSCELTGKKPDSKMVGYPGYMEELVVVRFCQTRSFVGQGYLYCAVYSKHYTAIS